MGRTAALGEAQVVIRAITDKLDADLGAAKSKIGGAIDGLQSVGKVALGGIVAVGAAITGLAIGAGLYVKESTLAAARTQEMAGVLEFLGGKVGWTSDQIKGNIDVMKELGIRTDIAQELLAQFARNQLDVADATMLARTAQDLAVLSGRDSSETLAELSYGIQTQNSHLQVFRDLGVQAGDALQKYAQELGVTTDELDKTQRMQAMLNAVQEAGVAIAGVYDTAMEAPGKRLRSLKRHFYEVSLSVGEKFLPAFGGAIGFVENFIKTIRDLLKEGEPLDRLFGGLGDLVGSVFNLIASVTGSALEDVSRNMGGIVDSILPVIETFTNFFNNLAEGQSPIEAFKTLIADLFPEDTASKIIGIVDGITGFVNTVWEAIQPVVEWISENVKLQDVLIALGICIATVVLPALWTVITTVAPVIGTFLAVVAAVALLRSAWENDFLGIRTALTEAWEGHIKPALQTLWEWLKIKIPEAVATVKEWWETKLLPALETVWAFLQDSVFPIFEKVANFLSGVFTSSTEGASNLWENTLKPAFETVWSFLQGSVFPIFEKVANFLSGIFTSTTESVSNIWQDTLKPALEVVWAFLTDHVFPLFQAVAQFVSAVFNLAIRIMAGLWQNVLAPALKKVFGWLSDKLQPVFEAIEKFWTDKFLPAVEKVAKWLGEKLAPAIEWIGDLLDKVVGWFNDLTDKLKNIKLPDWLTPGSPTPFEYGLRGISKSLRELSTMRLPAFKAALKLDEPQIAGITARLEQGGTAEAAHIIYNLNANYAYQDEITLVEQVRLLNLLGVT